MFIHAEHLQKKYHDKVILDIDTLNIEKGKIYGFVGENGAGKLCGAVISNTADKSYGDQSRKKLCYSDEVLFDDSV